MNFLAFGVWPSAVVLTGLVGIWRIENNNEIRPCRCIPFKKALRGQDFDYRACRSTGKEMKALRSL